MENTRYFVNSDYSDKVPFDFEDLPDSIVEKAIIARFEANSFLVEDNEYVEWKNQLAKYLTTIPAFRTKALTKGIEYGAKVREYHILKECKTEQPAANCAFVKTWDMRLGLAKELLTQI